jgi:transposase-like protein
MDFPIVELLDDDLSTAWLLKYFHPDGLKCPHCGKVVQEAREFRKAKKSQVTVHRCNGCQGVYNLYSGTVFEGRYFRPAQAVLLLRGICKGEPAAAIAREIGVSRQTVHEVRKALQANAEQIQPQHPLPDQRTETDEMFQNAGEKKNGAQFSAPVSWRS